jgi:hypothetical protein
VALETGETGSSAFVDAVETGWRQVRQDRWLLEIEEIQVVRPWREESTLRRYRLCGLGDR